MSHPTRVIPLALFIVSCCICPNALGELDLTAELSPVAGLPGYESYRITATSDLGNIVGYDFTSVGGYGITGSMNQLNPYGRQTVYQDSMFARRAIRRKIRIFYSTAPTCFPSFQKSRLPVCMALSR